MRTVLDREAPLEGGCRGDLVILETRYGQFAGCRFEKFLLGFFVDLPETNVVAVGSDELSILALTVEPIDIDQAFLNLRAPQRVKLMLMCLKLRAVLKGPIAFLLPLGAIEDDHPACSITQCDHFAFIIKF